jgi:hypothetical protein
MPVEQVAVRIAPEDGWTRLGGPPPEKPVEVVIRAFDGPVLCATGTGPAAPDSEPRLLPPGEGLRLEGRHFFVRPAPPEGGRLVSYRGL